MAHIHEKIDFAVTVLVVRQRQVLVAHHRRLNAWLPLGGHIELDEDPETAARREVKEESGLDIELLGERPPTSSLTTRALIAPRFLNVHQITPTHQHIGMIYLARSPGSTARLAPAEHFALRWCTSAELDELQPAMSEAFKWYCRRALAEVAD
ncbi:MAG: NUDIX domain-containing protein [Verrucomicrobiota bacterium]